MAVSGQSVVSFKPPVYLQRASVVRWGQCYKYTAQTVCGLLLLVHQPATEESEVITYKALKWNWGKNNDKCPLQLLSVTLMHLFWSVMVFSPVLLHPHHALCSWDFGKLHRRTSAVTENTSLLTLLTHTSQAGHKLVSIESMPLLIVDRYSSFVPRAKDMPGLG